MNEPTTERPVIDVIDLHHSFKNHKALDGISFQVARRLIARDSWDRTARARQRH